MDLRHLQSFVAMVDFGSLSKAAAQLYIAQPALSQQLSGLERELGTRLLIRTPHGVEPTPAGLRLYRHARTILRQVETAQREVREEPGEFAGSVMIGLPTSTSTVLALPLITELRRRYPGVRLHLFESLSGYLLELLFHSRLDLALLFRDAPTKGILVETLLEEDLFLISPAGSGPVGAGAREVAMVEVGAVPLVLVSTGQALRALIDRSFARVGIDLDPIADVDSLPTLIGAARAGLASTILPRSAIGPPEREHGLELRRLVEPGISRPVALCRPEALPSTPAAEAVAALIRELVTGLVRDGAWGSARLQPPLAAT